MGRKSTTGGVRPAGDRIELYFKFQGLKCRPTLDQKPTPSALTYAKRLVATSRSASGTDRFTYEDLAREFPTYKGLARFAPADQPAPGERAAHVQGLRGALARHEGQLSPRRCAATAAC
jgi:integrase